MEDFLQVTLLSDGVGCAPLRESFAELFTQVWVPVTAEVLDAFFCVPRAVALCTTPESLPIFFTVAQHTTLGGRLGLPIF